MHSTHIPFRPWCSACVASRALEVPHWRTGIENAQETGHDVVSFDLGFFGNNAAGEKTAPYLRVETVRLVPRGRVQWTDEQTVREFFDMFASREASSLFDSALCVKLARAGARRTDFKLPSVGVDRLASSQALYWKADLSTMEAQFYDPSPEQGQQPLRRRNSSPIKWQRSAPWRVSHLCLPAQCGHYAGRLPRDRGVWPYRGARHRHVHPPSARQPSRVMLTLLALHRLVRRPSRKNKLVNALNIRSVSHCSCYNGKDTLDESRVSLQTSCL